ncbi:hypothetical protein LU293_00225 [Moraxella nasovis]|uniref:hypothetical protein n=1 Tax=Moraxella nasovis TaxID=2904121 RepID=UPI001F60CAB3|nr:hypothetical protein [Moraxella nasovis]UNU73379.1 hypothetical protein LU293_00225 [Moraxella nasovis]
MFSVKKLPLILSVIIGGGGLALPFSSYAELVTNAASIAEFKKNPAAIAAIQQADQVGAALDINVKQTALAAQEISKRSLHNMTLQSAVESGIKRAYYKMDGVKRALRAKDHYTNYCDISEVAAGVCLQKPGTKSGINTDYGNIANNLTLNEEQINAGYSYVRNIIDPAKSDDSFCTNVTCKELANSQGQYHALGSMIQNSFYEQIESGTPWDAPPTGIEPIKVEQLGALSEAWDGRIAHPDSGVTAVGGSSGHADLSNLPNDIKALREQLISVVAEGESSGGAAGWNASNNGTIGKRIACSRPSGGVFNLTNMTLGQMRQIYREIGQYSPKSVNDCSRLFAAGKYQIIASTFKNAQTSLGLSNSVKFTPEVQKQMAGYLVDYRIGGLLKNRGLSKKAAKLKLAKEWAPLGVPGATCNGKTIRGFYDGGANSAACDVTMKVWAIVDKIDQVNKQQSGK